MSPGPVPTPFLTSAWKLAFKWFGSSVFYKILLLDLSQITFTLNTMTKLVLKISKKLPIMVSSHCSISISAQKAMWIRSMKQKIWGPIIHSFQFSTFSKVKFFKTWFANEKENIDIKELSALWEKKGKNNKEQSKANEKQNSDTKELSSYSPLKPNFVVLNNSKCNTGTHSLTSSMQINYEPLTLSRMKTTYKITK